MTETDRTVTFYPNFPYLTPKCNCGVETAAHHYIIDKITMYIRLVHYMVIITILCPGADILIGTCLEPNIFRGHR